MDRRQYDGNQLWMLRFSAPVPDVPIPQGWSIRPMLPGEGEAWSAIVRSAGFFTDSELDASALWDKAMGGDPTIRPENVFFACDATGRPVATATAKLMTAEEALRYPSVEKGVGYLHYVAALPECRGVGAGSAVTAAVIKRFNELGYGGCILLTDDFRLPAIKSYLRLGWLPVLYAPGMRERWGSVLAQLGYTGCFPALDGAGKDTGLVI